jgi:hypothetical protein
LTERSTTISRNNNEQRKEEIDQEIDTPALWMIIYGENGKIEHFGNLEISERTISKLVRFFEDDNEPSVSKKAGIFLRAEQI